MAKTIGLVADYEKKIFDVPRGCRRFLLKPDAGKLLTQLPRAQSHHLTFLSHAHSHTRCSHPAAADDDHWSLEFQDADGNVALIM